jgi:hypothetical protein
VSCYHRVMRLAPALALVLCGCPGGGSTIVRDHPEPAVADVVARLTKARDALSSFTAESVMDYWLGNNRAKGDVLVMGTPGAHVRLAALSPAGGSTLAELACDGANFQYIDVSHNCQLSGPCDRNSIATLLHVELDPNDFMPLALGTPPVLQTSTGKITWDSAKGVERVELESGAGKQTLVIDDQGKKFDVLASELTDANGKLVWSIENADFVDVEDAAKVTHRVPGKTRFKTPDKQSDLIVDWKERKLNVPIDPKKFTLTIPPGLPMCGSGSTPQKPASAAPAPAAPAPTPAHT